MRELIERLEGSLEEAAGGEWRKVSGGWPSKDPPVYEKDTPLGLATLKKEGKRYMLRVGEKVAKLSAKASFVTADRALQKLL